MNIEKGIRPGPAKVVIYGPEGIGKTTFASKFPKPLFLDLDNGSHWLDVDRVKLESYAAVKAAIAELSKDAQGYQTVVIDTADKLEALVVEAIINTVPKGDGRQVQGLEDYGYGKGYTYVAEWLGKFLDSLTLFQRKTEMNIVIVSHAWQRKVESPSETNSYDHYELKLGKKAAPLLREWPDFLFFLNYDINVMSKDGKSIATGGQRCIYTSHTPYYDAKTRADLPERLRLDDKGVAQVLHAIFNGARRPVEPPKPEPKPTDEEPEQKPEPKPESKPEPKPEPQPLQGVRGAEPPVACAQPEQPKQDNFVHTEQFDPQAAEDAEKKPLLEQLDALLKADGFTYADLELATSHPKINMRPKGTPIKAFSVRDLKRLVNGFDAVKKTIHNIKK